MKIISVVIICEEYPPNVAGGLGVHYFELINELKNLCEVNLITARTNKNTKEEEHQKNLHIYRLLVPKSFPLNHITFNIKALLKSLKLKKDIIHICSPFGFFNIFEKKPKIVKIHSLYNIQKGSFLYTKIFFPIGSFIDSFLIRRSNLVLTTSKFMKKSIIESFTLNKEKVAVIYNGINKRFFSNLNKEKVKNKFGFNKKEVVIYVGRFVQRKGALNLVKAIPDVIKKRHETLFLFVGGGFSEGSWYEKEIKKNIEDLNIGNHVKIIPWIDRDKLLEYYRASDIFVHPADYEPFGNNVLEAMATGLPVVVSKSGGPEEIVTKNGIILNKNEPSEISKGILQLLSDERKLKIFSKRSIIRAKHFSWKRNAEDTVKLYHQVLTDQKE